MSEGQVIQLDALAKSQEFIVRLRQDREYFQKIAQEAGIERNKWKAESDRMHKVASEAIEASDVWRERYKNFGDAWEEDMKAAQLEIQGARRRSIRFAMMVINAEKRAELAEASLAAAQKEDKGCDWEDNERAYRAGSKIDEAQKRIKELEKELVGYKEDPCPKNRNGHFFSAAGVCDYCNKYDEENNLRLGGRR